ncbi:hypothetical protein TNIN_426571 [Trichonephila inaurata madagascariensis]|uniref:Uncharacterized protein n=1 Tax=Trichonephila inaurata madagascariensis TaxID=2747483 RepID=A0A8X7C151_9ARAC|nr:hypothetical protein TNIN_426571 [Trichonephila inaurata madagascariensis]
MVYQKQPLHFQFVFLASSNIPVLRDQKKERKTFSSSFSKKDISNPLRKVRVQKLHKSSAKLWLLRYYLTTQGFFNWGYCSAPLFPAGQLRDWEGAKNQNYSR